ncbi:MAG: hypothetical protein KGR16_03580 [Verrucomicrobia bacterium]|nr:hypothetical protein [Verrucomicrobiota bacterium]MDE3047025.1 hypothetical protein [Verrucomicrobiota bacterium]
MKLIWLVGVISSALMYADETTVFLNENHRLYIEPDVAYEIPSKTRDRSLTIKESGYLLGINAGYEFLKANSLYAGLEATFSMSNRFADLYFEDEKISEGEVKGFQNNASGMFGYTLVSSNVWLTPFSGAGCYFVSQKHEHLNLAYVPIGIKAEYRMANFSIGANAQQLHFVQVWHQYNDTKISENVFGDGNYGYEISLPLSFKMDTSDKHWHAAFEPYYLKLTSTLAFIGGRISALYNF